jgi:hypothetical protein
MSISLTKRGQERGCDTSYRARRNDTHLTHGCIPLFRRFLRVRSGCACCSQVVTFAFPGRFEGAIRTLGGARA